MSKAKYVIVSERDIELPIVFNPILLHKDIIGNKKVISAGFCYLEALPVAPNFTAMTWHCYGGSVSLGLKSRPEDADILNKMLQYDC